MRTILKNYPRTAPRLTTAPLPAAALLVLGLGLGLGLTALLAAGCGDDSEAKAGEVTVSAGTTQLADIAANVAGDHAAVNGILDANSDPHDYEPRPSDAEALLDADLILRSGGELDLWLDELLEASGTDAPVLTVLDELPGGEGDDVDPHWWQDPLNAIAAVELIRARLTAVDPGGADEYAANAAAYTRKLRRLDRGIGACIAAVPADRRRLVTSHDALGYYADRYGIEVIGAAIPALTTQAQPSAGEVADLVELIGSERVSTIFPEAGVSADLERAIAEDAGARIGGELWADTLGPEGSDGETYLTAMAANTDKLLDGFTDGARGCDLPSGAGGG